MNGLDILGATIYVGATAAPSLADVRAKRAALKKGMKGPAVVYVQGLVGAIADGDFGTETEKKVKAFQKKNDLPTDGVVGWRTLGFLDQLAGGATAGASQVDLTSPAATATASGLPAGWVEPDWSTATSPLSAKVATGPTSSPRLADSADPSKGRFVDGRYVYPDGKGGYNTASGLPANQVFGPDWNKGGTAQETESPKTPKKPFPLWQAGLIGLGVVGGGFGIYRLARSR